MPALTAHEHLDANDTENDNFEADVHFEPVVQLPVVEQITFEEDEDSLLKLRAKLYRFDASEKPPVWKERGTGEIKLLHHSVNNTVRVVMRRDKTFKICANHFITPSMILKRASDNRTKWWIWTASADFADEVSKPEIFAIKFASEENANLWKDKFTEAQTLVESKNSSADQELTTNKKLEESSESEIDNYEDASDKSICSGATEGLSSSLLTLNINKNE